MFEKVLVANRGAIACRILRTLRRMKIASVAVFSEADAGSLHVSQADESVCIGAAPAVSSYLNAGALIAAARQCGAQAIHPGYGFLSESPDFAQQCATAGLVFVGPTPQNMRDFGLKHRARELALQQDVPLLPGSGVLTDLAAAQKAATQIGFPVMLKATAGGGGIGMRVCPDAAALEESYSSVSRLAANSFGNGGLFLERYVSSARHIEVQIFGDGAGRVAALGERDCSLQRRNQKIMEETPAPGLSAATRARMLDSAVRLASAARYTSAGTVEFLFDAAREEFYFLEVNARLQVEHGITEEVTGVDLVEWMLRGAAGDYSFLNAWTGTGSPIASGSPLSRAGLLPHDGPPAACSIQARLYAEDPGEDNRPSTGTITELAFPAEARIETWITTGTEVSAHYDPLLAKVIVHAPDRATAVAAMQRALRATCVSGPETNLDWLRQIVHSDMFVQGDLSTRALASHPYNPSGVRVLAGGLATTVQDYPGRCGYWHVGVPPSGPMDNLAFRLGNRLLGNPPGVAGLEVTALGPTLRFHQPTTVCLTGADCEVRLDGELLDRYAPIPIRPGQTLKLGRVQGPGLRAYILFAGGLEVPAYLGSRSTFTLGRFGGHGGRNLAAGDVLHPSAKAPSTTPSRPLPTTDARPSGDPLPLKLRPLLSKEWRIRVLYGPHGATDFFTQADIDTLLSASWKVHYNSSRTGVRLTGPKPQWARRDGGEAGLHPSNIHDNAYAVGAIDFTGDMPIILGPDGPSLGGFVCPFVVIAADLWKIGQLAPGDRVCFDSVSEAAASDAERDQDELIGALHEPSSGEPPQREHRTRVPSLLEHTPRDETGSSSPERRTRTGVDTSAASVQGNTSAIVATFSARGTRPKAVYRRQGDHHLLVEYGEMLLDVTLRLRVHALMLELERLKLPGVIDITPGIRSLQIHYDPRVLPLTQLLCTIGDVDDRLGELDDFEVPSRVIWLPLSFNDPAVAETIARYTASVRADAPWCPDNIEFIRRINGLASIDDVRKIVFDARYLVMGLGDVYLGAPVAIPLDPRHRLVTTKYNPARTWTPPNVVGIGGAYMCIYGMEGPGGYQLFGRTIQVWSSYGTTRDFRDGKPWLLRFFDQIRFFPVTHAELTEWRRDFPHGRRPLQIETEPFSLSDYRRFLHEQRESIAAFQGTRQAAFNAEREEWARRNEFSREDASEESSSASVAFNAPPGTDLIEAPLGGNIWRIHVRPGDRIERGSNIAAIEAMKTECNVPSPSSGTVRAVYVQERQEIAPGMPIIALEPDAAGIKQAAAK